MGRDLTLDSTTVNVTWSNQYRRIGSSKIMNGRSSLDESTPLLVGGIHPILHHHHHHRDDHERGAAWRFFLDTKHTPGTDSPNPLVRCPATVWNVAKVTLLSCMYILLAAPCLLSHAPMIAPGVSMLTYIA